MFDLEQSIADWRRQMLAAGIKTPVPLEELEIHLREEIERQTKSGLGEAEAFKAGVQKIGRARVLQNEFKKVKGPKMWRAIMLIAAWLVAGFALLLYGIVNLGFGWDFLNFHPKWDLDTIVAVLIILMAEAGIWFLAKMSRDRASRVVSLLVCLYLAGFALYAVLPVEPKGFLRSEPSPLWFRGGLTLLLCLPGVFWIWWERRHIIQKRNSTQKSQYV